MATKTVTSTDGNDVREYMRLVIERTYGSISEFARQHSFSMQYVSNVLHNKKAASKRLLDAFDIQHHVQESWVLTVKEPPKRAAKG